MAKSKKQKKVSEYRKQRVLELKKDGLQTSVIALRIGISRNHVRNIIKDHKLSSI